MSIYDQVKAEIGDGPKMAIRGDFKTFFGYARGSFIGQFPSKADAIAAGAVTVEDNFDETGYRAAQDAYHKHWNAVSSVWRDRLRALNPHLNDKVFDIVFALAEEDGHSSGHAEVENYIDKYADFAQRVLAAA